MNIGRENVDCPTLVRLLDTINIVLILSVVVPLGTKIMNSLFSSYIVFFDIKEITPLPP